MKRGDYFPPDTPEDVRMLALARRLYRGKNAEGQFVCILPKLINPPKSPDAETQLWAAIGRALAARQPEFRQRGRQRGAKNKKALVEWEKDRRKWREQEQRRAEGFLTI